MSADDTLLAHERIELPPATPTSLPDGYWLGPARAGMVSRARYEHAIAVAHSWQREAERLRIILEGK
jgi:hypothetical protein